MARAERGRLGRWREELVSASRGRIVEIGAGTGLNFAHYHPGTWVVATDPDIDMLQRAKQRAAHASATISLVAADGEALPFRDGAFGEAIVGLAMCTIPHPERALRELQRALETSGRLRLLEHVRLDNPLLGKLQDWMTPIWRRVAGGCRLNRRTVQLVAESGLFKVESVRGHLGGYVQLIGAVRLMCAIVAVAITACASGTQFFRMGPRPREIAGVWIDSVHITPQDTSAWVLSPDGHDRTLHITVDRDPSGILVKKERQTPHGSWYLSGALGDTARRSICFKQRARNGGTCVRFRLDTLAENGHTRRRRLIAGYQGQHQTRDRVVLERLP